MLILAVIYESRLREVISLEKGPSRERINTVFSILDDINPYLGSFSTLMKELREELYISVFSNSLTSNGQELERIPYFSSITRIKQMKKQESDRIQETLQDLNQRIKFRDQDINLLQKKNLSLKHEIADHLLKEEELLKVIKDLENQLKLKEMEKVSQNQEYSGKEQKLEKEIATLSTSLAQANHVIDKLTIFRANINKEADKKLTEEEADALKKAVVIDSQGMIEYDLYQMNKVDEQLLDIMNMQIDDLDSSLVQLKKKKEILSNVAANKAERETAHQLEVIN
jgi:chromosome segregation ATPase